MNKNILSLAITILLTGCAAIPDFTENKRAIIQESAPTINYSLSQVVDINREEWWKDFNDEQLNDLIDQIKEKNVDLKIAQLNLEKSETYYAIVNSNNFPILNLSSSFKRQQLSETGMTPPPYAGAVINMGQIGLSSRYTLDYLNKNDLLIKEQKYKDNGYKEQVKNVELSMTIQVIKSYLYYQYLLKEEDLINQRINLQNEIVNAYTEGFIIGKYTENQTNDIKNQLSSLKNLLNNVEQNKETTINILTQLAGNEKINLEKSNVLWEIKNDLPSSNIDIKLIRQRPDIKYYFTNIEAQRNHFEALKADFYPSISLTGDLGFQKVGFSDLLNKKSIFWNIGPEISLPIFDGGRIKTNYKIAGIDLNVFIENYNKAVYSAIQEVNSSLVKEKNYYKNLENQLEIYKNKTKNKENINNLYKNGKISKVTNMQSEIDILMIEEQNLSNELNYINSKIDVIQSLGGK